MIDTINISDYENILSSHISRHIELFKNYKDLSSEQKNAVADWAKRFNLGKGKTRFKYAQYISEKALDLIQGKTECEIESNCFVMEHIIPKTKYIIKPIIDSIEQNGYDEKTISEIIRQRLRICFITNEENKYLKNKISDDLERKFMTGDKVSEKQLFDRYFTAIKNDSALKNQKIYKIKEITQFAGKFLIETEELLTL